jgi:hypothetical protein
MRRAVVTGLLVVNIVLAAMLIFSRGRARPKVDEGTGQPVPSANVAPPTVPAEKRSTFTSPVQPATPFEAVYSARPEVFVANLRRVGCPEDTIKDILVADMNRRYRLQEEALRPKPADHVPWGWSPKTSEQKIIERRQQAAAIARDKESALRMALGYEVHVAMPLYAMTVSDRQFQEKVESVPPEARPVAYQIQDSYWNRVEQLRARTRGFWEPDDLQELKQLKQERADALNSLAKGGK